MARKKLKGVVQSVGNEKTVVVAVEQLKKHPKYKKYINMTRRFKAHNEGDSLGVGDKVVIEESRPISKDKNWVVLGSSQDRQESKGKEEDKQV